VVRYRSSGERIDWKSSIPISAAVCIFQPGSVKSGGTWLVAQRPAPLNTSLPAAAAPASKLFGGGAGAGMDSW
jgi:hypothetical protein